MVGEPKYPPAQIYWILDNVLKKTKNDVMSEGFEAMFGKTLTPTQIRYVKNKYGKDPDYNSPMVNKRLEYRGPGQLRFPPGYSLPPGAGGTGSAAGSSSVAHTIPPYATPFYPPPRPLPGMEHSAQSPLGFMGHVYPTTYMSPSGHAERLPGGGSIPVQYHRSPGPSGSIYMMSPAAQAPFYVPGPSSATVNPALVTSGGMAVSQRPIDPRLTEGSNLPPPTAAPPAGSGVDPSAVVKRPRDPSQSPVPVPTKRPKIEPEESRTPLPSAPIDSTPGRARSVSNTSQQWRQQQVDTTYVEPTPESQSSKSTGGDEEEEETSE
ncbi:hypothetical protein LIA77_00888 [Sarocladium implicatum]|nr:hypothetical protein LIA77_00888 [Sarocladium implicatum]